MESVILSSWDYIMGPQIERLWFINYNPTLTSFEVPLSILRDFNISKHSLQTGLTNEINYQYDLKVYSFMCGQLLLGEMDASEELDANTSRTYISDFKILISVVFRMKSWICVGTIKEVKNVSLSIGLIYKKDDFNFILKNQFFLDCHLRRLANILQTAKLPNDAAFSELSDNVLHVISLLDSLYHSNIDHFQNNAFSSIQDHFTANVLSKAIVSHLQTSGHTIVLGGSEFKIKQMVNILSLFSTKEEVCCSVPVNYSSLKSKVSAFYIQGIIKNSEKDCEYFLEHAFEESLSLTVVDTDLCRVCQTYPFHANIEKSRAYSFVTEAGSLIPQLLNDLSFTNVNDDCHAIIQNFIKFLTLKAVALVKTATHFRNLKRILSKQELMQLFAIYSLVDLQVILGCAEKVKPGIRCHVL